MQFEKFRPKFQFSVKKTLLTILGVSVLPQISAHAAPIPVETLSKLPALSNISLSRDGDYMVGLVGQEGSERQMLAVWDPRDLSKTPKMTKPDGDVEFIYAEALKAGKILVVARTKWTGALAGCGEGKRIGSTKTYLTKIFITDTNFSEFTEPFEGNMNNRDMSEAERICSEIIGTGQIEADLPLDPENVIIANRSGVFDRSTSYIKYNLRTNKGEALFKNRGSDSIGFMDPRTGEVLTKFGSDYGDGRYKAITLIKSTSGDFDRHDKLTSDSKDRHNVQILGRNENSGRYYVATDQFSDNVRIYEYDATSKSYAASPKFQNSQFDITSIVRSDRANRFGEILGYRYGSGSGGAVWSDPTFNAAQKSFERKFPGKNVTITDWTQNEDKMIVEVDGDDTPTSYFLYSGGGAKFLGSAIPELAKNDLQPGKLIYYTARDGMKIPGLLTMPAGWNPGDAAPPAIIHPHGGPWARDNIGWDQSGWVPFLTSRGYAVLRPQYRGSTGWGRKLWLAGDAEWGQKMQDDKDDGAAWMVEQGFANPDKIAIFGYSYGGYAAFAAAVRPNSPYSCAIGGAGVAALTKLGRTWSSNPQQRAYQGKTVRGLDPMENTDKANIPVLVFHGDRDVRVPIFHGKDYYKKVKRNVPAEMVVIKDMPHSLPWTPKMQKQSLTAIEDFLENDCF